MLLKYLQTTIKDIIRTKKIIDELSKLDVQAIKFQTYKTESLIVKSKEYVLSSDNEWSGQKLNDLYDKGNLPYEWHQELFDYSREKGLIPFSSVFDYEGLDFLLKLDIPILKISSYEANDPNFVETVLDTGIPTFISIGGLLSSEFERLIEKVDNSNNKQVVILNCLSAYPAPMSEFNFKRTSKLINKYGLLTGLSDHSIDEKAAIISLAFGVKVLKSTLPLAILIILLINHFHQI